MLHKFYNIKINLRKKKSVSSIKTGCVQFTLPPYLMSARESHPNVNFKVFDLSIYQQNGQDLTLLTVIFARAQLLRLSMII